MTHHPIKTRIVATLGPSSSTPETIAQMLDSGMLVARCNMSHGDHASHAALMHAARAAAVRTKRPLAILQDLCGPKIRIGDFTTETVHLDAGRPFTLTTRACRGDASRVAVNYAKLPGDLRPGMAVFLNDGKLKLEVDAVEGPEIHTTVVVGGTIRGRRGVNVPDAQLSLAVLTPKDRRDLAFGLTQQVDIVTLSFVRDAHDVRRLRALLPKDQRVTIVAKIETKAAIANLAEIIEAADALMVARGDLATEVPPERVPLLQKEIIRAANCAGKPVITATQMLDSMRTATVPTRAEVNDVANAILDGTDAVMLSDESAVGEHPVEAIRVLARIAGETENNTLFRDHRHVWDLVPTTTCDTVSRAIVQAAHTTGAKAIVAFSESGYTGRMVARYHPRVPIIVLTPERETYVQSILSYGCMPFHVHRVKDLTDARRTARTVLTKHDLLRPGDTFVLGAGIPFGAPGATNMLLVDQL